MIADLVIDRHIVLLGLMGSGKTTVGERLARRLKLKFIDVDAVIVQRHGPIAAIFATDGEQRFREYERDIISEVFSDAPAILSPGGGAVTDPLTRALLSRGVRLYLDVPLPVLTRRLEHSTTVRPLLGERPTLERVTEIYDARRGFYEAAECRIGADAPIDIVVEMALAELVAFGARKP